MNPDTIFSIANTAVLPAWVLLMAAPKWPWTQRVALVTGPVLIGLAYALIAARMLPASGGNFASLAGVAALFADRRILLAGWLHYLAFDLFVGAWEARDSAALGLPRFILIPCLLLTFLLGPLGLLLYLGFRFSRRREWPF